MMSPAKNSFRRSVRFLVLFLASFNRSFASEEPSLVALRFSKNFQDAHTIEFRRSERGTFHPEQVFTVNLKGKVTLKTTGQEVPFGGHFFPACASLGQVLMRKGIPAELAVQEILQFPQLAPSQVKIIGLGQWIPFAEWTSLIEKTPDQSLPTAFRLKGFSTAMHPLEVKLLLEANILQLEAHHLRSGIFIISGQEAVFKMGQSAKFERKKLPYQNYPDLAEEFTVPENQLSWELGKAVSFEPEQFQKLFPIVYFAALKEAAAFGVDNKDAFFVIHAPDAARARLYKNYGFKILNREKKQKGEHLLLLMNLDEATEIHAPEIFSSKLAAIKKASLYPLSNRKAMDILLTIKEAIATELDYTEKANPGTPQPLSLIDRSLGFHKVMRLFLESVGISAEQAEGLRKDFQSLNTALRHVVPMNDRFISVDLYPHIFSEPSIYLQNLPTPKDSRDHGFYARLLYGAFRFYEKKYGALLTRDDKKDMMFSVLTEKESVAKTFNSLGADIKGVDVDGKIYVIRFPWAFIETAIHSLLKKFDLLEEAEKSVQRAYWQTQTHIENSLIH